MGKVSTTQSVWRSGGGDSTRQAYCGSGIMGAQFYVPAANAAGDNVQVSATNTASLVLPAGAVVLSVVCMGDSGAAETFDMGYGVTNDAFVAAGAADAADTIGVGAATAGTGQGVALAANSAVTAGGTLTAAITGWITYFVQDPLAGQQNV